MTMSNVIAATQEIDGNGKLPGAAKTPNVALHASFEAGKTLVAADASCTGQFAMAALRVLQHGTTGMHTCPSCAILTVSSMVLR